MNGFNMSHQYYPTVAAPGRPPFRYHGSKWRLAPWIIKHFPAHRIYVEPFGGSAAVMLRKKRVPIEVYNDLDEEIVNFFQVLRDVGMRRQLIRSLRYTPYARNEFKRAYNESLHKVERARRMLVRAEMGFGSAGATSCQTGFRGGSVKSLRRKSTSRPVSAIWAEIPSHVESVAERLRGVIIECVPAIDILSRWNVPEALIYVDPPYPHDVRELGGKKGAYRHEMNDGDHKRLIEVLLSMEAMVVVSGYPGSLYDESLEGWSKYSKKAIAAGRHGGVERTENIYINKSASERMPSQKQLSLGKFWAA